MKKKIPYVIKEEVDATCRSIRFRLITHLCRAIHRKAALEQQLEAPRCQRAVKM